MSERPVYRDTVTERVVRRVVFVMMNTLVVALLFFIALLFFWLITSFGPQVSTSFMIAFWWAAGIFAGQYIEGADWGNSPPP